MYDIAFICYDEPYKYYQYFDLTSKKIKNKIYMIEGVKGIHNAHIEAAKKATTPMFYAVDADAKTLPNFKFNLKLDPSEEDIVHVWRSRNPVNGLEYGYGGVKLLPTQLTLNMDLSNPDMTTSISSRFKIMPEVANITMFNTDPLRTWRSAFRECAKLSSKLIKGQLDAETQDRLHVWQHNDSDELYADYARAGAIAGNHFGETYKDNPEMLKKINDYEWLQMEFDNYANSIK